jgi:hypothetical protein
LSFVGDTDRRAERMERFAFVELSIDPTASGVIIVPAEDM